MEKIQYIISGPEGHIEHTIRSIISTNENIETIQSITVCNERSLTRPYKRSFSKLGCRFFKDPAIHYNFSTEANIIYRVLLLDRDISANIEAALSLTVKYKDLIKLEIYAIAPESYAELLFDSVEKSGINPTLPPVKLRRIFPERNLIYKMLYNRSLFDSAYEVLGEKIITLVLIGYDIFIKEMIKACLWCGQMDGYILKLHIISESTNAEDKFYYDCPEVKLRNKLPRSGEDYYELNFYNNVDLFSCSFLDILDKIENPSWVFISAGTDSANIETGIKVREFYSGKLLYDQKYTPHYPISIQKPVIQVICEDDISAKLLNENKLINYKEQCYNIEAVGYNSYVYDISNLISKELETLALNTHLNWGDAASFDSFEYNRLSSMASAIHKKYRELFYPDNDVLKDILEHKRWNAFMRGTLGYTHGLIRDDLARQHNCLVKYDELPGHEKEKDSIMNT